MKKALFILFLLLFSLTNVFGQKKGKKTIQEKALEDVKVLSSLDFPYIDKFHEALREKISGNYDEAKKLFNACLEIRQDDDAVYFGLAEIYKSENQISQALENYQKAFNIDPDNITYIQELAYMNFEKANFEEAEGLFDELCKRQPRNIDFRYGYIQVLIYNKKYKFAIEQIDKLQEQIGVIPELANMKVDLYMEQKKSKNAEETLLQLNKEYPDDPEVLKAIVKFYEQQGEGEKAQRFIEDLAKKSPDNGTALFVLANKYLEQNKIEDFVSLAPTLFSYKDLTVEQKLFIFDKLKDLKSPGDPLMVSIIEELYQSYPENNFISLDYSNVLVAQKKTKKALEIFRKTIHNIPDNFDAWESVLFFESRFLEYKALYEDGMEAVTLFPMMPVVYYIASEGVLYAEGSEEAMQLLAVGEMYILGDKKMQARFEMRKGQIYFYQKKYKKGIVEFEKALSSYTDETVQINYAYALAEANIALDVAKELLDKIAEKDKGLKYYLAKAIVEKNTGNIEKGIKVLENGVKSVFNNGELYDLLGDFYFDKNAPDQAVKYWEKAVEEESRNIVLPKKIKEKTYYAPKYI